MKRPAMFRIVALSAFVLAMALNFPGLMNVVRLKRSLGTVHQAVYTGDLVDGGPIALAVPDTLREAEVLRDVVGELAGDYPGRLGDLRLGVPQATPFGRQVEFSVIGTASFGQMEEKLLWLEGLWPLAHVRSFKVSRGESGAGLDAELAGRFEFRRRLPVLPELQPAESLFASARDPFRFGSTRTSRTVRSITQNPSEAVVVAEPFPGFQGTAVLGGDKVAFFGGKSYRPGERVAGRLLIDVIDGHPVFGSNEDSR